MRHSKAILFTFTISCLLTACGSLLPVHLQPSPPITCIPQQYTKDALISTSGLLCTAKNVTHPFPVTARIISDLSYPLFTEEIRNSGVDNPLFFWKSGYAGFYQIGAPVSEQILIYVNGYNGRPTGWKIVYESLKHLPLTHIFFNYPTGDSLETTSIILSNLLHHNRERLRGKYITLLAHSQGGLIVVRATQLLAQISPDVTIDHIITAATPWQGCSLAGYAKIINPICPKVFDDIDTGSDFLKRIKNSPLPDKTQYTLIHVSTFESNQTAYPTDELFSRLNQCETGTNIVPTQTYGVISSHSRVLTSDELINLLKQKVRP